MQLFVIMEGRGVSNTHIPPNLSAILLLLDTEATKVERSGELRIEKSMVFRSGTHKEDYVAVSNSKVIQCQASRHVEYQVPMKSQLQGEEPDADPPSGLSINTRAARRVQLAQWYATAFTTQVS